MNKTLLYSSLILITVMFLYFLVEQGYTSSSISSTFTSPSDSEMTSSSTVESATVPKAIKKTPMFQYIEVINGCGPYFTGECVNMRSGTSITADVMAKLRTGIVLKVIDTITSNGREWYKIGFDKNILYPERVTGDWFVAAGDYVQLFANEGDQVTPPEEGNNRGKRIIVDISSAQLYAYEGDAMFMKAAVSTGLDLTPTPKGTFTIFKKTPSRYMQGPLPGVSDQAYDLPGVPWDLYFTKEGAVIHGAYWHDHFGEQWVTWMCEPISRRCEKIIYVG